MTTLSTEEQGHLDASAESTLKTEGDSESKQTVDVHPDSPQVSISVLY